MMSYTNADYQREILEWQHKHGLFKMTKEAWEQFGKPEHRRHLGRSYDED